MIHKQKDGVHWLEFELLQELPLIHGCLLRHGGVSSGQLDSLNLGNSVGDHPDNVRVNYRKVAQVLALSQIVTAKLSHGATVTPLTSSDSQIPLSDALMTSLPHLGIVMTQADCQAAIFYDPLHHAIANVHCGWRGSTLNIYANTIESMQVQYGTNPADLLVCISPSLGPKHAEFIHYKTELPESFWQFKVEDNCFDFWAISRWQLETVGVPHHIQVANIDTYSHPDYFSHRRSMDQGVGKGGRQATVCALQIVM